MIQSLLHGDIITFLVAAFAAVAGVSFHEFAHAFVARWQGDPTAKLAGRMTLNPRRHLDPVGSFMILLVGVGWGKPVPVAENKLRRGKTGTVMVFLAGPIANLLIGFVLALALRFAAQSTSFRAQALIGVALRLNVALAVFNLIPVPPLDGFPILAQFLTARRREVLYFLERWSFLILLIVAFLLFGPIAAPLVIAVEWLILRLAGVPA